MQSIKLPTKTIDLSHRRVISYKSKASYEDHIRNLSTLLKTYLYCPRSIPLAGLPDPKSPSACIVRTKAQKPQHRSYFKAQVYYMSSRQYDGKSSHTKGGLRVLYRNYIVALLESLYGMPGLTSTIHRSSYSYMALWL